MDKTILGAVALIIGIAVLIESLFADGIGIGNAARFGQHQVIGTAVGAALIASGLYLLIKSK